MGALQKEVFLQEVVGASSGLQEPQDGVWWFPLLLPFSSCSERKEANLGLNPEPECDSSQPQLPKAKPLDPGGKTRFAAISHCKRGQTKDGFTLKSPPRTHRPSSGTGNRNTTKSLPAALP